MKKTQTDLLIIGAGLTGLALHYYLRDSDLNIVIIEARERIGGRIHTVYSDAQSPLEMGATWLGKKHVSLVALLQELKIDVFEQEMGKHAIFHPVSTSPPYVSLLPENMEPSYRIKGGSSALINKLVSFVDEDNLFTNEAVLSISAINNRLAVKTSSRMFEAAHVVSTLPPFLLHNSVEITPPLPTELQHIAKGTHTWMGESIKIGLTFNEPFWRAENSSGTVFSNVGAIPEMYDHSNPEDTFYSLKGFMNGAYFSLSRDERLQMILSQLSQYYGNKVKDYLAYHEVVWQDEAFTYAPYGDHILPHQNNGHPVFQHSVFDGRLFIAGSETSREHPGYMDGAVVSARHVATQLIK
ncbi:MAG: flavin monoamine oxidase family protein [Calditrichia bacterium]